MTRNEFSLRLSLQWGELPEGDLSHETLNLMRDSFGAVLVDARLDIPCSHPREHVIKGRCFQCGRLLPVIVGGTNGDSRNSEA